MTPALPEAGSPTAGRGGTPKIPAGGEHRGSSQSAASGAAISSLTQPPFITAPWLFARVQGHAAPAGAGRCFFCGVACDPARPAPVLPGSFTALDTVAGGNALCDGCVLARNETANITLPDGVQRVAQRVRAYSWVVSERDGAIAATKAHRTWLRGQCLFPPPPPYVISLAHSGQRHLLYRARVGFGYATEPLVANLEGEAFVVPQKDLRRRLDLCAHVAVALGAPALSEAPSALDLVVIAEFHQDAEWAKQWREVYADPLTRLAAWLTPPKKELIDVFRNTL